MMLSHSSSHPLHKYEGAAWKVLSGLLFAAINGCAKAISLPVVQSIAMQNLLGALFLGILLRGIPQKIFTRKAYFLRAVVALPGAVLWLQAIRNLPICQTVALGFMGPFFTTLGAKLFFKESIGPKRIGAILMGTVGGMTIVYGPKIFTSDMTCMDYHIILPLVATLAFSLSSLVGKYLAFEESAENMTFSLMFYLGLLLLLTLPLWTMPSLQDIMLLSLMGLCAACAHFAMSKAMAQADLTFLLPFGSTRFIASTLIGWYFYEQMPTYWVVVGMGIILGGLWLLASSKN